MKNTQVNIHSQIIAAALLIGGTFNLVAPVMAEDTKPNTLITNKAKLTYGDLNGTRSKATSNTVSNTLVEVAGITKTPKITIDVNVVNIQPNDVLNYNYVINVGDNKLNKIFTPSTATILY